MRAITATFASFWLRLLHRLRRVGYAVRDVLSGRPGPRSVPSRSARTHNPPGGRAHVTVECHANWGDFDDALQHLTPGASGVWDDVAFVRAGACTPDWTGIFNQPPGRGVDYFGSPSRLFFAIGEPPTAMHRPLHIGQGPGSTVFTSNAGLVAANDGARRYVLTPPMLRTWSVRRTLDQLRDSQVRDKSRSLSWVTSDVATLQGHRDRLAFLERLRRELAFDLFGRGFRRLYDKWDGLAPYRYSIAYENTRAPYYFSEKLMDCFVCDTMPIYVGSPRIADFFPRESLVVIDPASPDVVDQIRSVVASDLAVRSRDAIHEAKRRVLYDYNVFAMLARLISEDARPVGPATRIRIKPCSLAASADDQASARAL